MKFPSWFKHYKIDLHEETVFTGRLHIPVQQLGIAKVIVVRTKRNGGIEA